MRSFVFLSLYLQKVRPGLQFYFFVTASIISVFSMGFSAHAGDSAPAPHKRMLQKSPIQQQAACDPRNSLNAIALNWIQSHYFDAAEAAIDLDVAPSELLGISAIESGWGKGDFVRGGLNNFFGLHHPAPYASGFVWNTDRTVKVATFDSYSTSARSFATGYGKWVKSVRSPVKFASILQNAGLFGINSNGSFVPNYVKDVSDTILFIAARVPCFSTSPLYPTPKN